MCHWTFAFLDEQDTLPIGLDRNGVRELIDVQDQFALLRDTLAGGFGRGFIDTYLGLVSGRFIHQRILLFRRVLDRTKW